MEIFRLLRPWLQSLRFCCFCWSRKKSRYGYSVIRGRRFRDPSDSEYDYGTTLTASRRTSLESVVTVYKPLDEDKLEIFYDNYDEILNSLKHLKFSKILGQVPSLARPLTNQLADQSFLSSGEYEKHSCPAEREKHEIFKQNLIYIALYTENVNELARELGKRAVLEPHQVSYITDVLEQPILKSLEIYKLVLKQKDAVGFLIGALKVTGGEGNNFVAEIFIGNSFPDVDTELICKISLTPEFSPEFRLHGTPSKIRVLRKIPIDRQEILTAIFCSHIQFKGKTLLKSLEYCKNLQTLSLTDVILKQDFRDKVSLPSLKSFTLHITKEFPTKKDFLDCVTPEKIFQLLFFITGRINPDIHSQNGGNDEESSIITNVWNIKDIWNLNIDISLKIGGRAVLIIDHWKSKLFSRLENFYAIPENIIQPRNVKNLYLGWCSIARSSIPIHLTKLSLHSIDVIDSVKKDLNVIFRNSSHLRELRMWNFPSAQSSWPLIKFSNLPKKLKTLAASFVEIDIENGDNENGDDGDSENKNNHIMESEKGQEKEQEQTISTNNYNYNKKENKSRKSPNSLENICLFMYDLKKEEETEEMFLKDISQCKRVSLINFPPYKQPTESQLFFLMQSPKTSQIFLGFCDHHLNVNDHWLYLRKDVLENIQNSHSFLLNRSESSHGNGHGVWNGKAINKLELNQHLCSQFGFDELYSFDSFMQQESVLKLWKNY